MLNEICTSTYIAHGYVSVLIASAQHLPGVDAPRLDQWITRTNIVTDQVHARLLQNLGAIHRVRIWAWY